MLATDEEDEQGKDKADEAMGRVRLKQCVLDLSTIHFR
jgi:hypothetical protein